MSKRKWHIKDIFVFIHSIVISLIFAYVTINKWLIRESISILWYPFFKGFIWILAIISLIISLIYAIQIVINKQLIKILPLLIIILTITLSTTLFSEGKLRDHNFNKYLEEREEIVLLIQNKVIDVDNTGSVQLSVDYEQKLDNRKETVEVWNYNGKTVVYFKTFAGLLETSSGYVYYLNENIENIQEFSGQLIEIQQFNDKWRFCSTN